MLSSAGEPLDAMTRGMMEPRLGHDLGAVRMHTGPAAAAAAQAHGAAAFTIGRNIVFGHQRYAPQTSEGRALVLHELAHTIQQNFAAVPGHESVPLARSDDAAEREAADVEAQAGRGWPVTIKQRSGLKLACKPGAAAKTNSDPVVSIVINLTSHQTVFRTVSGVEYHGSVETDLDPGVYELTPNKAQKKWGIKNVGGGLRFDVNLTDADPWALAYPKMLRLQVVQGTKDDLPMEQVLDLNDTVDIKGDPAADSNYIQNVVKAVGIFGWGGPFRLYRKLNDQQVGYDDIILPRSAFHLDDNPLAKTAIALNQVYKTPAAAEAAVKSFGQDGVYAYYIGTGGHIYPTVISDTTAPYLCAVLRKAVAQEKTDAKAAEHLSVQLLLWYAGARFPATTNEPPLSAGAKTPPTSGSTLGTVGKATTAAGGTLAGGGGEAFTVVEIGAGDLKASIELAQKGGVKVIAVDPVQPAAEAVQQLQSLGGSFVKGTAQNVAAGSANQVFQYFPWQIEGTGSFVSGGTWRVIDDAVKLLKPDGNAYFVTESKTTAEFLAGEASKRGLKAVLTDSTAAAAAPGASGAGVPGFAGSMKVWLVNIYK